MNSKNNFETAPLFYKGIEGDKEFFLHGYTIKPLGFSQLENTKLDKNLIVKIEVQNGKIVSNFIKEEDKNKYYSFSKEIDFKRSSKTIALVNGGWLPSGISLYRKNTIVILDRNAVTEIIRNSKNKETPTDLIHLLNNKYVKINPCFYALEGNTRETPNFDLISQQLEEVTEKLEKALPEATLLVGEEHLKGISGIIEDTQKTTENKIDFLLSVSIILKDRIKKSLHEKTINDICNLASIKDINKKSLLFLAVISYLTIPNGASPAVKILKFKDNYSRYDAYNTMIDFRALDLMAQGFCRFPEIEVQFYTGDKNLALFWVGINAHNFHIIEDEPTYDIKPEKEIIPEEIFHNLFIKK